MKKPGSWSHTFWVMKDETLVKKILPGQFWNTDEPEEKRINNYTGNYKAFCVTRKRNKSRTPSETSCGGLTLGSL